MNRNGTLSRSYGEPPHVLVSYAQSIDGSIALNNGTPLPLSGGEALEFTHRLRARHDAILVGIGTVLSDDPLLTVRYTSGKSPQPIVLDSLLRIPIKARLFDREDLRPWIFTTEAAPRRREEDLRAAGARVLRVPSDGNGRVNITAALRECVRYSIMSIMVEGGGRIITSFIEKRCVDEFIITVSLQYVGGMRVIDRQWESAFPRLKILENYLLGDDLIIRGVTTGNGTTDSGIHAGAKNRIPAGAAAAATSR